MRALIERLLAKMSLIKPRIFNRKIWAAEAERFGTFFIKRLVKWKGAFNEVFLYITTDPLFITD